MNNARLTVLFDQFQQSKYWGKLPGLQKGLMIKTYEDSKQSEHLAKEFYKFLENTMTQKKRVNLSLRK